MKRSQHPDDALLLASISGEVDVTTEDSISEHLSDCQDCQQRLELLVSDVLSRDQICQVLRREAESSRSSSAGLWSGGEVGQTRSSIEDFAVSFLQPSDRDDALGRLGDFEVLSVIGYGGMGIVLKGFQEELNRPVAIKVMAPQLATNAVARTRFLREAQATAAIVHPNVMPILSVGETSLLPFLVMPFVACHSLQQRLDVDGALPIIDVLRIGIQVAAALAAAHKQGLVHRDVKPANILLERGIDRAMLTDFGLARAADDVTVTRSGVIAGTPQYMSPEQARGEAIDARSDLFSLGSVLYAMATGQPPFRSETSYGVLRKITDHEHRSLRVVDPSIPVWFETLVNRLLCKDKVGRYQDAEQVQSMLEDCLTHVQQPNTPPPASLMPAHSKRSRLILIPVAIVAIITVFLWNESKIDPRLSPPPVPVIGTEITEEFWNDPIDKAIRELNREMDAMRIGIE
jgi:serine/threonine protein kinase